MSRSNFPFRVADKLDSDLVNYLVQIGSAGKAVSDLAASPTTDEIATAFNALLASLRAAGKLDQ